MKDFELIEEISWDGKIIAIHPKSMLNQRMFVHKVALVIPRSENGYIFARRGINMTPFPDTWVCAIGGKVKAGETFFDAAVRESKEEAGIKIQPTFVTSFSYDETDYKAKFEVFTTSNIINIESLIPDRFEVQYFVVRELSEMENLMEKEPSLFAPTFIRALSAFVSTLKKINDINKK